MRLLLSIGVLLSGCASVDASEQARTLEVSRNRLFLPVMVNGAPASGLLDSAAEMSVVDDDFADRVGLVLVGGDTARGTGGTAEVQFAEGVSIQTKEIEIPPSRIAVLDLEDVSTRLLGRPIDVIVGRGLFDAGRFRIDIESGTISNVSRDRRPRGTRLALRTLKGVETFGASVEGHPEVQADFDLGNGSEVLIGRAYAERIGLLLPSRIIDRAKGGGIGGGVERDIVILKSLTVGGRTFTNIRAAIDPTDGAADLNIGTSILRHFVITTDFAQRSLWLDPR